MTRVAPFATVVAPDLPGFGRADKGAGLDYTIGGYARFLDGVITALRLERVHLVAHDFGGPFATAWAADHPDRVASMTLINTGVLIGYRWHRMARLWRTPFIGELAMRLTTPAVARWVIAHDNPGLERVWIDTVSGHLGPWETKRAVLRLYRSTRIDEQEAIATRLRSQNHDALVVFGDADAYIPVEQAYRQSQAFPRAQIRTLPGVGTGVGWNGPTGSPSTSCRSCASGSAQHRKAPSNKEIEMSDTVDTRPVNLAAFANLPPDAPVFMINLLKFNAGDGRERYLQYGREVQPHLERVGAAVRYAGTNPHAVIGDSDTPWWDAILVVEYPNPQAFVDMVRDEGYQNVHEHRAAALQQGDLVATSQWVWA